MSNDEIRRQLETSTRTEPDSGLGPVQSAVPGLTVLFHPELERTGERALLDGLLAGERQALSRLTPDFAPPGGVRSLPLADPHLSRQPCFLEPGEEPGSVVLDASATPTTVALGGARLASRHLLSAEQVARGVVLVVGARVVLLLSNLEIHPPAGVPRYGLVGESAALWELRRAIRRLADLALPVLLRGPSGSGKELVARALHDGGPRRGRPFVAVNLGAIPPTLAAAELFGAAQGAFTGADRSRPGYFERAEGGTLFLDEIGEAPPEAQVPLLRAVESGEIQPVGARAPRRLDVRLIAATDADLEAEVAAGRFRAPLLHRLGACAVTVPPLVRRREDFGRLLVHFLRREAEALGPGEVADPGSWLSAPFVARLAEHPWPGNVRELGNVARRLVLAARERDPAHLRRSCEALWGELAAASPLAGAFEPAAPPPSRRAWRPAAEVADAELEVVLQREGWRLQRAAAALGVSRASLYDRIAQSRRFRKAVDLGAEEILAGLEAAGGDLHAAATRLEVSRFGLQRRMRQLGLRGSQ